MTGKEVDLLGEEVDLLGIVWAHLSVTFLCMRGSRMFCQRGSKCDNVVFFLVDGGIEDPNTAKMGHHRLVGRCWPNIECWLGSFVILLGIRTSIAKKPYILWFFRGVPTPCPPSGSGHVVMGLHWCELFVNIFFNPFMPNGISHLYQLDESNLNLRVVG